MTIDELAAEVRETDTETPTVTLSADDAAAIAETYQDADEQRHAMAEQLQAAAAANLTLQATLDEAQLELGRLRHENTTLIRHNAVLRRESNALISKFADQLREALGLEAAGGDPDQDDADEAGDQGDESEPS